MTGPDDARIERLRGVTLNGMSDDEGLDHIAMLIDCSDDARDAKGVKRAHFLIDQLAGRNLSDRDGALLEYFRANAWAAGSRIAGSRRSWAWENAERQEELLALSRAAFHPGFDALDPIRRCQILTNRANVLDLVGRTMDAIEAWDAALAIEPKFGMARGNRGRGLRGYAGMIHGDGDRALLLFQAHDALRSATEPGTAYENFAPAPAMSFFQSAADEVEDVADLDAIREFRSGLAGRNVRSKAERRYREWCSGNRLMLSPLCDVADLAPIAVDDLMLPPILEGFGDRPDGHLPPTIIGFFSQLKQEYVSARYMLHQGLASTRPHFSDRDVSLTDTLDYPLYSLASEKVRTAFRVAYSLLDKIAFFVDRYWALGKRPDRISFKNVWFKEGRRTLLPSLDEMPNLALRGLYWISKDLFDEDLKETVAPDARQLHAIRNALEHGYLRVTEGWAEPFNLDRDRSDAFGLRIDSDELEAKALRIMKTARSSLMLLAYAVGAEERSREAASNASFVGTMPLVGLDYARKRRDPS